MRKIILLTLIIFFTLVVVGQGDDKASIRQNEIGINLFYIKYNNAGLINRERIEYHFSSGIMYKKHSGKNALRAGLDYYFNKYDNNRYLSENKGKEKFWKMRLGFERKLLNTKLQPYYVTDIELSYMLDKGSTIYGNASLLPEGKQLYEHKIMEVGLAPALGVKYHFTECFSASVEISLNLMLISQSNYNSVIYTNHIGKTSDITLHPLRQFSINYHF